MENKGCSTILRVLFNSITYITWALPLRSVPTFVELLIGAMITQSGFLTQALAIHPLRTRASYCKWLRGGKWSWVAPRLKLALTEMYVQGVSIRKVTKITEELCGLEVLSAEVSRASKLLDEQLSTWRERPLNAFPYVYLDAGYEKVR
ncbi:MAG: hypothetical protein CSA33_01695 [Desulfobulbus propionicus]|nr:MAG: hypothetical protein CSA33_01695 [Desulfobulbus propionicus]